LTLPTRPLPALFLLLCVVLPAQALPAAGTALHWFRDDAPTPQARAVVRALEAAEDRGLRASDYDAAHLASALAGPSPPREQLAVLEAALDRSVTRFVNDLRRGRVDPARAGFNLRYSQPALPAAEVVARLAGSGDVAASLQGYEPRFLHYRLLEQWLVRYRDLARQRPQLTALPPLPRRSVKEGEDYSGSPALRRLLAALGDLPEPATGQSAENTRYDAALAAGVRHFQDRLGLPADGALGRKTWDALSVPLTQRVRQIELTLERWRWLPEFSTPPIIVNIPQFRLFAFRTTEDRYDDILQMPVIVGESFPGKRTPVFAADLKQLVFRPFWDVPESILRKELLQPIQKDPAYLERHHLELVRGQGDDSPVVAPTPDNIEALAAGRLRLRQRPGPDNSLGLLKFVFPNDYGVYMHGTPAQELFARSRRDFSHGCIRLSDPAGLAVHVLRDNDGGWSRERIESLMSTAEDSTRVVLARPIRVLVLYGTALATEDGRLLLFDDIYGHDRRLERLLAATVRSP